MTTVTGLKLIKNAMFEVGALGVGKTPAAGHQTDVLARLNTMLDAFTIDSLMVPYRTQISHTLDGSESYSVGASGTPDINTTRPTFINSAYVRTNGIDYPLHVLSSRAAYDGISDKDVAGTPRVIYYEPTMDNGTLFVWPVGSASDTVYLSVRGALTQFADTTTEYELPPGYDLMLYTNLAINIAPMFEASVSAETAKIASESLAAIKRLNRQSPVMSYDYGIPMRGNYYDIAVDG